MKISHEVPICLLEDSLDFNDYQYCLPHLLDKDEDYKNFFYKAKQEGVLKSIELMMKATEGEVDYDANARGILGMEGESGNPSPDEIPAQ